ncbi:LysR substrate-binding domain-containing protein [Paraburkholderia tropica]|uniref:LysR substrate-binding domain-containing protein n=1 Tax=Paraburkholderia tropica TaxID=92647 RepID=UPI002AB725DF|nr:LysR substrate-binding domain-containing protein [Paraburkholderia tropica]
MNIRKLTPSMSLLLAFESAGRHQSYTLAAQELTLTQSAVSRQVQALEALLSLRLFERRGRGIVLTDVGRTYLVEVGRGLAILRNGTLQALSFEEQSSELHVATLPTFGAKWLLPRLHRFYANHPGSQIDLHSRIDPINVRDLTLDAAIVVGAGAWPGMNALRLLPEKLVLVGSPRIFRKGQSMRDVTAALAEHPLLRVASYPQAWSEWSAASGLLTAETRAGPSFELTSHLIQAACAGIGIALVPQMFVEDELQDGRLDSPLQPVVTARSYYLVYPEQARNRRALHSFIEWLLAELQPGANQPVTSSAALHHSENTGH